MFDAEERVFMAANPNFTVDTHLLRELGELLVTMLMLQSYDFMPAISVTHR